MLEALQPEVEATGVHSRRVHYLWRDAATAPAGAPSWARTVRRAHARPPLDAGRSPPLTLAPPAPRAFRGDVVPPEAGPGFATGRSYVAPVVAMPLYLVYLERLVAALGGSLECGTTLARLGDAAGPPPGRARPDLVVNCAGLGAAGLLGLGGGGGGPGSDVPDGAGMVPVRGVLVLLHAPGVEDVYSDESWDGGAELGGALCYIVPKGGGVVACGGCAQPGATGTAVSVEEAEAVVARCAALLPRLLQPPAAGAPVGAPPAARVLAAWAGLRPYRPAGLRLEREGDVVHCYGNGGSGAVISWGCAADVAALAGAPPGLRPRPLPQAEARGLPPLPPPARGGVAVAAAKL